MKILFLSTEYPPETPNGIGAYVTEMGAALSQRGHEVHVLSCVRGQTKRDYRNKEVSIHRRDLSPGMLTRRYRGGQTAARMLTAFSNRTQYAQLNLDVDVVEAPDWLAEGLFFTLGSAAPLIVHLHTPLPVTAAYSAAPLRMNGRLASWLEGTVVRHASLLTSPSRLLADELELLGWLRARDVSVIRYPIDVGAWSVAPAKETQPSILVVGRVEHRKGPDVLVEAGALLARQGVALEVVFVGRSGGSRAGRPYRDWLLSYATHLGCPCRVHEQVPRSELPRFYSDARVVAMPSRYDNFPFAALEAMASRRPVVCTTATGIAELLAGSAAGSIVPAGDAESLATALRPYLLGSDVAQHAGEEAAALVQKHCAPSTIAVQREAVYAKAIAARKSSPPTT